MNIHTIITHIRPHLDEIVAIWLLRLFGESLFPGVKTSKIVYWNTGGHAPDGRSAEDWEAEGYLLIGIGKGRFDEHSSSEEATERQKDECSATLVAKALGVNQMSELAQILKYTLNNDTKGSSTPFDIATIAKHLGSQYPNNPEIAIQWTIISLNAKYAEQCEFFSAKSDFEQMTIETITGPYNKDLVFAYGSSDNEGLNKYARSPYGCNADVVAIKRSSGNVQIFFNQKKGLKPIDLIKILRTKEQIADGKIQVSNWNDLGKYGNAYPEDAWYLMANVETILNSSATAIKPPTKLSLEEVVWSVKVGLNPNCFEESNEENCLQGKCSGTKCPFYQYGLSRCRNCTK